MPGVGFSVTPGNTTANVGTTSGGAPGHTHFAVDPAELDHASRDIRVQLHDRIAEWLRTVDTDGNVEQLASLDASIVELALAVVYVETARSSSEAE